MNEKLFQKLRTTYASLGLGDALIKAHADTLAASGLVTDENIETIVAAQKGLLETFQKTNDKRATDAIQTAREKAEKEHAEAIAKLQAELDAAKKLAGQQTPPQAGQQQQQPSGVPEWYKAESEANAKRYAEIVNANKALTDSLAAIKKENEDFRAARAAQERKDLIAKVSTDLGIPAWRQEEGFNIAADATPEAITEYLTKVSNNIKAQTLPSHGIGLPMGANGQIDKEQLDALASSIVKHS